jgi:hypothetical protein
MALQLTNFPYGKIHCGEDRRYKMREVSSNDIIKELEQMGVAPLSGEGCNMGLRLDTDVSPAAAPLVEEWFGVDLKLKHTGFNGWAFDGAKYHEGRSSAYTYDAEGHYVKKEGWTTHDGFCFKLPRSMMKELWLFMTLKQNYGIYQISFIGEKAGLRGDDYFLVFKQEDDFKGFQTDLEAAIEKGDGEYIAHATPAQQVARTYLMKLYTYRYWVNKDASANRHAWSGKMIA